MEYSDTRIYKLSKEAQKLAKKVVPAYSSKFSKKTYTQDQHIAILCVKTKITKKFYVWRSQVGSTRTSVLC